MILHITLKHRTCVCSQIEYNFTNCLKKYANIYFLKRHLIRNHQIEQGEISHSNDNNNYFHNNDKNNTTIAINNVLELRKII